MIGQISLFSRPTDQCGVPKALLTSAKLERHSQGPGVQSVHLTTEHYITPSCIKHCYSRATNCSLEEVPM